MLWTGEGRCGYGFRGRSLRLVPVVRAGHGKPALTYNTGNGRPPPPFRVLRLRVTDARSVAASLVRVALRDDLLDALATGEDLLEIARTMQPALHRRRGSGIGRRERRRLGVGVVEAVTRGARRDDGLWLYNYWAAPGNEWGPDRKCVFRLRKVEA